MTSVGVPNLETWRRFEGQIVNGEFHLHQYLGGSDYAGVFLTQRSSQDKVAIKLIPEDPQYAELQLARWRMAERLEHPHLLRIFGSGRCDFEGERYLYVVMQYADENLSHILPHRALSAKEVKDALQPLAQTLQFLHDKGIVHGHVKPANIMAVEDELKFSSDGLSTEPDSGERPQRRTAYDAPESYDAPLTPACDVWSLGITLVEALTQRLPTRSGPEFVATGLPAPFGEIARNCLRIDPHQRWSIPGILARLEGPLEAPPLQIAPRAAEKPARSAGPAKAAPIAKRGMLPRYLIAIAVALIVIAIAAVSKMRDQPSAEPQAKTVATVSETPAATSAAATSVNAAQPAAPAATSAAAGNVNAAQSPAAPALLASPSANAGTASVATSKGTVVHEVMPNVSPSAQATVQGHLKLAVRVAVNAAGDVVDARFENPGPSKYFSRVSMEAARGWKFKPPQASGQNVASEWILRFEFTKAGTHVTPTQVAPKA
ncbi:MAG: protein kinase [Acidobacteriaceae bacterium]|nr:protein kinase [Acidobacteriaceae bacterium]